jgi:hypothetical protein
MVAFMMAIVFLIYFVAGMWIILADSMTVDHASKWALKNDFTFFVSVMLWPIVVAWAKWQWPKK